MTIKRFCLWQILFFVDGDMLYPGFNLDVNWSRLGPLNEPVYLASRLYQNITNSSTRSATLMSHDSVMITMSFPTSHLVKHLIFPIRLPVMKQAKWR